MRCYIILAAVLLCLGFVRPVQAAPESVPSPSQPAKAILPHMIPPAPPSGPLPQPLQGIWSAPDCADPKSLLVLSAQYQLSVIDGSHRISTITQWRSEDFDGDTLFFYLTRDGRGYFLKMTNDGIINYTIYYVHPGQMMRTAWSRALERLSKEFSRCTKLFPGTPVVTQDDVNLPFLLDKIYASCSVVEPDGFAEAAACQTAIFETLDTDQSGGLDQAEVARLSRQVSFLEGGMPAGCAPRQADLTPDRTAANFAQEVFTFADTDKNAALDFAEAKSALTNPLAGSTINPFIEKLRHARSVLRFLPLSDAERHCTTSSPTEEPERYTGVIKMQDPSPLSLDAPGVGCGCGG